MLVADSVPVRTPPPSDLQFFLLICTTLMVCEMEEVIVTYILCSIRGGDNYRLLETVIQI